MTVQGHDSNNKCCSDNPRLLAGVDIAHNLLLVIPNDAGVNLRTTTQEHERLMCESMLTKQRHNTHSTTQHSTT